MTAAEKLVETQFKFDGVMIEHVIMHRIHPKSPEKELTDPTTSNKVITLSQPALDTLQKRIQHALGNKSHGIEMSIASTEADSFFQVASGMVHALKEDFIEESKGLAKSLSKAQLSTNAPGGMLVVIRGRVGEQTLPFVAVIKAEPQDGFRAKEHDGQVDAEYLSEILLTETQRLYKIGFLVEVASTPAGKDGRSAGGYRAFLFDHLMTATETRSAAAYFYSGFLGMSIQASSKKLTQDFFEFTRAFIDTAPIPQDDKLDLHEALRTELKSQDATISVSAFATKHMPDPIRAEYSGFMSAKGFPENAINKDTGYIQAKLKRRRKYVFTNGVWLVTPPGEAKDMVEIDTTNDGETVVTIKGGLERQQ
ncbi:nucleoid-associated protein [Pseudomonas sp. TMP9]|uniref:nucleoid-associated protein n=1 Tax=Pseudomonas sp. TMP9 TaxID=3133144 RepID=UPI0030CADC6F